MDSRLKEEFLTCIICHEVFRDPVTLHCGHTICSQCVTAFTKTQHQAIAEQCIPCPHCRALTKIPDPQKPVEDWAGQIKTGFFVKGLVETFLPKENVGVMCSPCSDDGDKTKASVWCPDCDKALCKDCQKVHRRLMSSHSVSDLTARSTEGVDMVDKKMMCEDHKDTAVDMMCQECDIAVCPRCCIDKHKGCIDSVVRLTEAMPKITAALQKRDRDLQENIVHLHKEIPLLETQLETLDISKQKEFNSIELFSQTIATKLKSNLQDMKTKDRAYLQNDLSRARASLQDAKKRQILVKDALSSNSEISRYELCKTHSIQKKIVQSTVPWMVRYEMKQTIKPEDLQALGIIKTVFDERQLIANKSKAVMTDSTYAALQSDTNVPILYDVKLLERPDSTTVVVTDTNNLCVKSFQYSANKTNKSHIKFKRCPLNLTIISDAQAAVSVTDLKQIIVFDVTPNLTQISRITTRKAYTGLSYFQQSQFVVSNESGSVDIIDMSGVILRSLCPRSFNSPGRVLLVDTQRILVTDTGNRTVRAITDRGESVFTYKYHKLHPRGVAKSLTNEYFVVNSDATKVLQFSETGKFVRDVVTSRDGLQKPAGLCLDRNNKMYVVTDTGYIQEFALYKTKLQ